MRHGAATLFFLAAFAFTSVAYAAPSGPLGGELMKLVAWAQWTIGFPLIAGGFIWAAISIFGEGTRGAVAKSVGVAIFGLVIFKAQVIAAFLQSI